MNEPKDDETFLTRWSRRKVEARRAEPEEAPSGPPGAAAPAVTSEPGSPASAQPPAPLPTIEELRGLESEYREFLQPGVDETLRRSALKKLFQDPHFNVMDGLDTYIDDYTKADPIPEAMLRALNHAQGLIFDREDEHGASETQAAPADATGEQAQGSALASSDPGESLDDKVTQSEISKPGAPG